MCQFLEVWLRIMIFLLMMIIIFLWMIKMYSQDSKMTQQHKTNNGQSPKKLEMEGYWYILCITWTTSIRRLHATENGISTYYIHTCNPFRLTATSPVHMTWIGRWSMVTIGYLARSLSTSWWNTWIPFENFFHSGEEESLSQLPYSCWWNHTTFEDLQVERVLPWKCLVAMASIPACNYWLWRNSMASKINKEDDCHHHIINFNGIFKLFVIYLAGIYILKIVLTSWAHLCLQGSVKTTAITIKKRRKKWRKLHIYQKIRIYWSEIGVQRGVAGENGFHKAVIQGDMFHQAHWCHARCLVTVLPCIFRPSCHKVLICVQWRQALS